MTPATSWWRRVDSNHRSETQQIYSLPPLATRELLRIHLYSNKRPAKRGFPGGGDTAKETGFRVDTEAGAPKLMSRMELVDGFEPPTC